jgi:uncharacterized SAM-binding protein YcdF (DUF218 family)
MIKIHKIFRTRIVSWKSLPVMLRRQLFMGGLLLVGANLLVLNHERLLIWFAYRFRVQDPLVQSDAIVVLLGSPSDRSARAAELFRQGLAPIILIGRSERFPVGGTEYSRKILMQNGVPAEAIRILPGAVVESTHDEALRVRDYVRDHPVRRLTVVTTAFHTARARWTFQTVFAGSGVDIRMVASQNHVFTEHNWYTSALGIKLYLLEALKTISYRLAY